MKLYQLLKKKFITGKDELPPALMTFSPSENLLSDSKGNHPLG
jgi:hypothetical protein